MADLLSTPPHNSVRIMVGRRPHLSSRIPAFSRVTITGGEPLIGASDSGMSDTSKRLVSGIRFANQVVCEAAKNSPSWKGMGTTIVAALADGDRVSIAHAGDSRAYLVRSGTISQLTDDHSVVAEQVRRGLMSKEEAEGSGIRNLVTRALGDDEALEADVTEIDIMDGDRLLLCSDGLNTMVTDDEVLMIMASDNSPESACTRLVDEANNNGGKDNITVVVAFFIAKVSSGPVVLATRTSPFLTFTISSATLSLKTVLIILAFPLNFP